MYRVKWGEVTFTYDHNSSEVGTSQVCPLPRLGWVKDYDDSTALTDIDEYEQYSSYRFKVLDANHPVTIRVKPRVASAVYGSGVFSSYSNVKAPWIDCNSPSVEHYGIKWYIDGTNSGSIANDTVIGHYQMHLKLHFQCKVTR